MAKYSTEFKVKIVKEYLESNSSYQSLANELKITNPAIITSWVNDFRKKAIEITNKTKKNISLRSRLGIPNKSIHIKTRI